MSPADLFQTANTPMAAARLWTTWIGMAVFVALLFFGLVDYMRHRRLGPVSIALTVLLLAAAVLLFVLPRS